MSWQPPLRDSEGTLWACCACTLRGGGLCSSCSCMQRWCAQRLLSSPLSYPLALCAPLPPMRPAAAARPAAARASRCARCTWATPRQCQRSGAFAMCPRPPRRTLPPSARMQRPAPSALGCCPQCPPWQGRLGGATPGGGAAVGSAGAGGRASLGGRALPPACHG